MILEPLARAAVPQEIGRNPSSGDIGVLCCLFTSERLKAAVDASLGWNRNRLAIRLRLRRLTEGRLKLIGNLCHPSLKSHGALKVSVELLDFSGLVADALNAVNNRLFIVGQFTFFLRRKFDDRFHFGRLLGDSRADLRAF